PLARAGAATFLPHRETCQQVSFLLSSFMVGPNDVGRGSDCIALLPSFSASRFLARIVPSAPA
ncbi:MAG TPA: hypothetical protein VII18_05325, partial [Mycobacterium sp.]